MDLKSVQIVASLLLHHMVSKSSEKRVAQGHWADVRSWCCFRYCNRLIVSNAWAGIGVGNMLTSYGAARLPKTI